MGKKKKYTVGLGGNISDTEYATTPKVSANISKKNKDGKTSSIYSSIEKPLNKINKQNINSNLTLGYSKTGKNSSFNVEGSKSGKDKNVSFNFTKTFSKGSEIKINKVAKKLEKASKLHAGQAKTLKSIKLVRGGGAAIRGLKFQGVK
tara:strand:+ start:166 stop:609 length:444 start_codon:yes stop_codon:yes gene_type:complete